MLIFSPNASGLCVGPLINGVSIWTHLVVISNYDTAVCALDSAAFTMTLMTWKTVSIFEKIGNWPKLPAITITTSIRYLDFLKKSSSRGGPRVPRPLLLVKVTAAAAAARTAPLAQSSKFSHHSRSRPLKKSYSPPLLDPLFRREQDGHRHVSARTRAIFDAAVTEEGARLTRGTLNELELGPSGG